MSLIGSTYRAGFERVLTRIDPEKAHHLGFRALRMGRPISARLFATESRPVERMGISFPGILGLAAGFDKNGQGIDALAAIGFGFVEIGTITGQPQPGNPRPRLSRLTRDQAIVNRMGFNNDGAQVVAKRLSLRRANGLVNQVPLGINIGKSKVVPETEAVSDYERSTGFLAPYADYLVVNVSSPNTPGLRNLQAVEKLEPLLRAVRRRADQVTESRVPLLVKIAPDLSDEDVLAVGEMALALDLDGIIATNTTISRDGLLSAPAEIEAAGGGGLSGPPLRARATEVIRMLRDRVGTDLTLIGAGGITTTQDALERLTAGADLLQGYTAFIYQGPTWPSRLNRDLIREGIQ
ncbi:MAG TPA: quinone-dependent dihydroorotate dehydrogenase [Marmoricola sp.]|nr:quinone-dependent dihydroorotate dehydrogenase [Marmoricola sp.]HNN47515.1 quinone-dependent dihydroorotate dehydrogenase [Marmoricola sp.]